MGERRRRVFVVELDKLALDTMILILGDEAVLGCEVKGALAGEQEAFQNIKEFAPDLVVLDFTQRENSANWRLLDRLRSDEATSSIPVLALSVHEDAIEQTLASFNVRTVIEKPFDLETLEEAVRGVLREPRVQVPARTPRAGREAEMRAADVLMDEARAIVLAWLQRAAEIEPFKTQKRLRPRQLLDNIPAVLWGTMVALRSRAPEQVFSEQGAFHGAARKSALTRKQQGVPMEALVREYSVLRDVMWDVLRDKAGQEEWTAGDVFQVGKVLHRALDEALAVAIKCYQQDERKEKE